MKKTLRALIVAVCLSGSIAGAQDRPIVTLQPADPSRWDAAGHIGWLGINRTDVGPDWNRWHGAAAGGVNAGYYLTPHLKLEVDASGSNESHFYSYDLLSVEFSPYGRPRNYVLRSTAFGAGMAYQFFENAWFHPFAGLGVDAVNESIRSSAPQQLVPARDGRLTVLLPPEETDWHSVMTLRPAATVGFKGYVSERAFIRADVHTNYASGHFASTVWRTGVGFDF